MNNISGSYPRPPEPIRPDCGRPVNAYGGSANVSAELERMEKNIALLAESIDRAIAASGQYLSNDPRKTAPDTTGIETPPCSPVANRLGFFNTSILRMFEVMQNFGTNLDT